jgi:hypothetical protein
MAEGELLASPRAKILRLHGQCKSVSRTLYKGFRRAKLKKSKKRTWDSASLRHGGFKKAKKRAWNSASLGAKTLREIMLKNS